MYDTIIIGGGPAGLAAALYSARRALKTLLITKDVGGQANLAYRVENYPGFKRISGIKLMQKFYKQALQAGAEIVFGEVVKIKEKKGNYLVKTRKKTYEAKTLILAFGKIPRNLNVPGEKKFEGKGVSYCAICDMPLFKNKVVAVVGGGNSALDAALYGSKIAKKVYLIHRRKGFRAFEYLAEKLRKKKNVELILNSIVKEIRGKKLVKSVLIQNVLTKKKREISVDGVFVEIGYEAKTDFVRNFVKLDKKNQIVINQRCETFYPNSKKIRPGVFAAGDVTHLPFKQIVISAGEGAKAALQAYAYIKKLKLPFITNQSHRSR
jgi:thioredoxin reductase (NADPH)